MDMLYTENYFILSIFLSFFMIEVGIAVFSIFRYAEYGKVLKRYLIPIWAIDGTFAVFYLVNLEAAYPALINTIGYAYVAPILIGGLFLILRNAFLAYSELTDAKISERQLVTVYAFSTLVIALIVIYSLSSGVSGFGINTITKELNIPVLLTNGFNLLVLISVLILSVSSTILYFNISYLKYSAVAGMLFSLVLVIFALSQYDTWVFNNLISRPYIIAISVLAMAVTAALAFRSSKYTKYAVMATLILLINLFGMTQYPYTFGASAITAYENNSSISGYVLAFTTVGMVLVIVFLGYLFYLSHKPRRRGHRPSQM